MSLFDDSSSVTINGELVESIKLASNNTIIYDLGKPLVLIITGNSFKEYNSTTAIIGTDKIIDYGDGTVESLSNRLSYTYTDGLNEHIIKIYNVTELGTECFRQCTGLTEIIIPNTVTSIGEKCFYGNRNLTNVDMSDNITTINHACFSGCSNLTSIIIPSSVTILGRMAFSACSSLTNIIIPNSVINLEEGCFINCASLKSIDIPNSVRSIGESCFSGCSNLTDIDIPYGVVTLGEYCFWKCTSLRNVHIPSSVTSIGNYCFKECSIYRYYLYWTVASQIIKYSSKYYSYSTISEFSTKFSIPKGRKSSYKNKNYDEEVLVERTS